MLAIVPGASVSLPALVDRAAATLTNARTSAEVLEAIDMAKTAYVAAKHAGHFAKAKDAHDTLVAAAHRAQADALEIEARAKRRLADEYDAAQERGEAATQARHPGSVPNGNAAPATAADLGLTRKQVHEARQVRDAEKREPGVVRRVLDDALAAKQEPTRAKVKEAIRKARSEPRKVDESEAIKVEHGALLRAWNIARPEARERFLSDIGATLDTPSIMDRRFGS